MDGCQQQEQKVATARPDLDRVHGCQQERHHQKGGQTRMLTSKDSKTTKGESQVYL